MISKIYFSLKEANVKLVNPVVLYQVGMLITFSSVIPIIFKMDYLIFILFAIGALLLSLGFCWEVFNKLKDISKNNILGSILIGLPSSALVGSISYALAQNLVNEAILYDPKYFENSVNILTVIFTPYILALFFASILGVFYIIIFPIMGFMAMTSLLKSTIFMDNKTGNFSFLWFSRIVAAMILSASIFSFSDAVLKNDAVRFLTKATVVWADFYKYGRCENVVADEHFSYLDDNKIIVIGKDDSNFEIRVCE